MKSLIESLLSYLSNFRKLKKTKETTKTKIIKQKTANILVYGVVSLFFLIGLFGAVRSLGMASQVDSLRNEVKKVKADVSDNSKGVQLDTFKVNQYLSDFIKVYINYDESFAEERLKKLDGYYSFDMSSQKDVLKYERVLTGQRLIALRKVEDFYIGDVKVSFETVENGQVVSRLRILSVPFRFDSDMLAVVELPFFKKEDDLQGVSEPLKSQDKEDVELVDEQTRKSVVEFLGVFFDKYAASEEVDLSLLMKVPVYMGGQYAVESIIDNTILVYKEGDKTVVQVAVSFVDKGSEAVHTEHFTLYLTKQDSGWYVEELLNYFK